MRIMLFSIALAGALITGAASGNTADYGMPSDVAQSARARCAKAHESLSLQDICMENEGKAYGRLTAVDRSHNVRYDVSEEERKARVRSESGYRDPPGTRALR
jgi:hypothetical protein